MSTQNGDTLGDDLSEERDDSRTELDTTIGQQVIQNIQEGSRD